MMKLVAAQIAGRPMLIYNKPRKEETVLDSKASDGVACRLQSFANVGKTRRFASRLTAE